MMKLSQIFLALCILSGIAFLTGLGMWQMERLAWKQAMIERVNTGVKKTPVPIEQLEGADDIWDIEYRPTFATGRFDHSAEQHYFITHKGTPGYFIYTPLELEDGRRLFVNRGFVPITHKDPSTRTEGQVEGIVKIEGLARSAPHEKPNSFTPNNDLTKNIYYWKSISEMAAQSYDKTEISTVGLFLDANDAPNSGGLPQGGVTRIEFINNHLQYALTWFGLAIALLCVGGLFLWSRVKPS